MKKTNVFIVAVLTVNVAFAQKIKEADVPKAVTASFSEHFKGAKAGKWDKENDGNYEAEFDWNKTETSATFSTDGKLLETETEIKTSELPKSVSDAIAKDFAGYKLSEAAKIVDPAGVVKYEAEVQKGKEEMDLIFDPNGKLLKKEVEKSKEKDDKK